MLPKRRRLSRREFEYLLKQGRRVHGTHLSLLYAPTPHSGPTPGTLQCGVVVSKKTAKKATMRNLVRRRVYAVLQEHVHTHRGYLAVFTKPSTVGLAHELLVSELRELMARIARQ